MHLLTQPRHLDTISRRVKLLVNDLERVHEARRKIGDNRPLNIALSSGITVSTGPPYAAALSGGTAAGEPALPPDALQKIDALFTLLPRIDPLIPLTPHLLTRLRSLSTLHSSSSSFHKDLQDTQENLEGLKRSEEFLKELLGGLEQSLKSNRQVVKNNLESIQGRIDAVMQRLDKLS
jgi:nuclear migration protein JNM1